MQLQITEISKSITPYTTACFQQPQSRECIFLRTTINYPNKARPQHHTPSMHCLPVLGIHIIRHQLLVRQSPAGDQALLELPGLEQHPQAELVVVGGDYGTPLPFHRLYRLVGGAADLYVDLSPEPFRTL